MKFNILPGIFDLLRKTLSQSLRNVGIIIFLGVLFVPNGAIRELPAKNGAPPGWVAHNPIIIRTPPSNKTMNSAISPDIISGLYPIQIRKAYGIDLLGSAGAGKTIAIIDAYGNPTMAADLVTFDNQFGLPAASITIVHPGGVPGANLTWAIETALDVEWAHAVAPAADILLVEAKSPSETDLLTAVDYATVHGADVISMSWGAGEFPGEDVLDTHFNHAGITYVASSGDTGGEVDWPAVSSYVTAVGGTTLSLDANGNYLSESAWSGSGGGTSVYVARPGYQNGFQSANYRGVPDVAFDADPNSGVAVYCGQHTSGWLVVGGTSLSAPCWAGLFALGGLNGTASAYAKASTSQLYSGNFHDITTGSNGNPAVTGYDLVTGLGSPKANNLVPGTPNQLNFITQPSANNTAGMAFSNQPVIAIQDANRNTVTTSTQSVALAITSGTGTSGATISGTTTVNSVNGVAAFNGLSIDKAGNGYTLTSTSSGLTVARSIAFNVVAGAATKLSFTTQPSPIDKMGVSFITQPVITVQDAQGNKVTSPQVQVNLSITVGTGNPEAALSGTFPINAIDGMAVFSNIKIDKAGVGYTLTATSAGLILAISTNFNVTAPVSEFDGDGKTDIGVYRPTTGDWYIIKSDGSGVIAQNWGVNANGDVSVPGDYDGDGKADVAVYRPTTGDWYIIKSNGTGVIAQNWGISGDIPVPGDYDGDGKADIGVYRPSTGDWYIIKSNGTGVIAQNWGISGDIPVPGDYDGDGKTDIGIYRPTTGDWYIIKSNGTGVIAQNWGVNANGDVPVPGDYDGDGKTDIGVYRPTTGDWYIIKSNGTGVIAQNWGISGDIPVPGDYDGDGKTDIGVYRPTTGDWYIIKSNGTGVIAQNWGISGDEPLPNLYLKF